MPQKKISRSNNRRDFLGKVTGAAALLGMTSIVNPLKANGRVPLFSGVMSDPDDWFKTMKGKHRIVFDCTEPKAIFPFAWPKVYMMTNAGSGTPEKDCNVVVVLRHDAFMYALQDNLWAKYKFGETHKINDPRTGAPALRNPFWQTLADDYKIPGVGAVPLGIKDLQADGVMFCVCDVALTVNSAVIAMNTKQDAAVIKKEWTDGLIPGIPAMPSGVWAVGRAQENGCGYCYV
jgi:intracellular sulfur oxidation DsrE/DsrF family protein